MKRTHQGKIKRNREFRACTECRKRKLKCDRQSPCSSCSRRNEATGCVYTKAADEMQAERQHRQQQTQAEARLEHLEQLVQDLARSQSTIARQDDLAPDLNAEHQHHSHETPKEILHNGATHWSAVLEDIEELRNILWTDDDSVADGVNVDSGHDDPTGLLFGATQHLSFPQILSQFLPSKHKADRLVSAYFRMKTVAAPFIHHAQFTRQYGRFWDSPATASPLWTSILFSILEIATKTVATGSNHNIDANPQGELFDAAAAHCLTVGNYHKPQHFAVEALALYAQSKCLTSVDLGADMAVLFGTLIRLATTMGYHRELEIARRKLSAFEGEMRRRTWSMCVQLDMLVSFQLGLPSNVQYPTWDTRPPTNLLNTDFDEDTIQLPAARPSSEPTDMLLYIAKHRLMAVFEKVIRHTLSATGRPSNELEAIDQEVRSTMTALPIILHPRTMAESIVDPPSLKVTRLCVNSIYHKCLCVLHRKYVGRGRRKSLQVCYTSASEIVGKFLDVYKEFEPGGQLETEQWFMGSITWHDFLLGCMALCLVICVDRQSTMEPTGISIVDIDSSLTLIRNALEVCDKEAAKSKNTKKVQQLLGATLRNVSSRNGVVISPMQHTPQDSSREASAGLWQTIPSSWGEDDWIRSEGTVNMVDETGWAFMEQFLNLPIDGFMIDT